MSLVPVDTTENRPISGKTYQFSSVKDFPQASNKIKQQQQHTHLYAWRTFIVTENVSWMTITEC